MSTHILDVEGMTCQHCVGSVTKELSVLEGVHDVHIDLNASGVSTVTLTSDGKISPSELTHAIEKAGYSVVGQPRTS
jgi:copper chaperone